MTALLIGSISTLADTSELQRAAFNTAFDEHGLDWHWDRNTYRSLLTTAGGRDRIAAHAASTGDDVDADAIHHTKSTHFHALLADGVSARDGVAESIAAHRAAGDPVGLVTTTSPSNVDALLAALDPQVTAADFDVIVTRDDVDSPKPDPAAYRVALDRLGIDAADAVAVEDNLDGAGSAMAAGVRCVAFPNANTADHDFSAVADRVVTDRLPADVGA